MNKFLKLLGTLLVAVTAFSTNASTIKIVVGYAPGGGADKLSRFIQQNVQPATNKNVIVEFKLGAGSEISTAYVAQHKEDETVLLLQTTAIANHTKNPAYNITTDLIPVVYFGHSPFMLIVNSAYPHKKLSDLKDAVKLDVGSGGVGTLSHANAQALAALAKNSVAVPYKGMGEFLPAVLSNQVNMGFVSPSIAEQHIQSGKVVPVAVTSNQRLADYPTVPTFTELGYRNFQSTWYMLLSNATAKPEDIKLVQDTLIKALQDPAKVQALKELDTYYEPRRALQGRAILAEEIQKQK